MAFLSSFDIAASGMSAQRLRMDIAAENIANIDTTRVLPGGFAQCFPGQVIFKQECRGEGGRYY